MSSTNRTGASEDSVTAFASRSAALLMTPTTSTPLSAAFVSGVSGMSGTTLPSPRSVARSVERDFSATSTRPTL